MNLKTLNNICAILSLFNLISVIVGGYYLNNLPVVFFLVSLYPFLALWSVWLFVFELKEKEAAKKEANKN